MIALALQLASSVALAVAAYFLGRAQGWNSGHTAGYMAGFDAGCAGLSDAVTALRSYGLTLLPTVSSHQDEKDTPDTPTSAA